MYEDLKKMIIGEEKRDASSRIKGFLFQDYYAVELLFNTSKSFNNKRDIICECIEDIIYTDGKKVICVQAKYSEINNESAIKSGILDLYMQFLKCKMYGIDNWEYILLSTDNCKIECKINENDLKEGENIISIPESEYEKEYEKLKNKDIREVFLLKFIHKKNKEFKEGEKSYIEEFNSKLKIDKRGKLEKYKKEILDKISNEYKEFREISEEILFAICIEYIQENTYIKRIKEKENGIKKAAISFESLKKHIKQIKEKGEDEYIRVILNEYISELYINLCRGHTGTKDTNEHINFYNKCYEETKKYIAKNVNSKEFKLTLKNTLCYEENNDISVKDFQELKDRFKSYFRMIWKMLYIYKYELKEDIGLEDILGKYDTKDKYQLINIKQESTKIYKKAILVLEEDEHTKTRLDSVRKLFGFLSMNNIYPMLWYWKADDYNTNDEESEHYGIYKQCIYDEELSYKGDFTIGTIQQNDISNVENNEYFVVHCTKCLNRGEMFSLDKFNLCVFSNMCHKRKKECTPCDIQSICNRKEKR